MVGMASDALCPIPPYLEVRGEVILMSEEEEICSENKKRWRGRHMVTLLTAWKRDAGGKQ